jgi:hypothetical protein
VGRTPAALPVGDQPDALVREALGQKAPRHHMDEAGSRLVLLPMMGIGG